MAKKTDKKQETSETQLTRHHYAVIATLTVVVLAIAVAVMAFVMVNSAQKSLDNADTSNEVVPQISKPTAQ